MQVSYNWIKDYLDFDIAPEDLGVIMTDIGLEVEGIEEVEAVKGGLKGVVVGEVITKEQHPNADRLSVTTVRLEPEEEPVQIVCGAPNVKAGLKVLVATIGTTLYTAEGEPFKIKKGKIRGEESHGMICAEDELGLGQSHDGIMELGGDAKVGQAAAEFLQMNSDFVFDVGLTPNRSDATGHLGVAKDIKAYLTYHSKDFQWKTLTKESLSSSNGASTVDVVVEDQDACRRYSGVTLGVKVQESPAWIKERLNAVGVRPINNIVDITNFVLHEMGQPLHAFDYDKIDGQKIIVAKLEEGRSFVSLDEQERKLSSEDLMICDGNRQPMCIAGVFGGLDSGVTDGTTRIFLESAHFEAISTRRSSTRHLLFTDAAKCFEKGSDPSITVEALERAWFLLKEYADAEVLSEVVDIYPNQIDRKQISIDLDEINTLLGYRFSQEEIDRVWTALEMEFSREGNAYTVLVPTNKSDVTRPADLVEEVLRIVGMNNIPVEQRLSYPFGSELKLSSSYIEKDKISALLASRGLHEAMGLSLTQAKWWEGRDELVKINNTSNIHLNVMRPNLIASMLESVAHNLNRQNDRVHLFEWGREYRQTEEGYGETDLLGIVASGPDRPLQWKQERSDTDFYHVHEWVQVVLNAMGVADGALEPVEDEVMNPCFRLRKGKMELYRIGQVSDEWSQRMGIKQSAFGARIAWEEVNRIRSSKKAVQPISKFPKTSRDLALVMDQEVGFAEIQRIVTKQGGKNLEEVALFDIYTNQDHLGQGKKSYAIKLTFGKMDGTMKDKEVDQSVQKIVDRLSKELNITIRS